MKKILIITILFLCGAVSAWGISFEEAKKAAEQGNASAQYNLGVMYDFYHIKSPLIQNCEKAVHWYKKAAEQGHIGAQRLLGELYCKSILSDYRIMVFRCSSKEIVQDFKKAIYWFKKAADQGDVDAQFNLGVMYYEGKGVAQDYKQALHWYNKTAEQGLNLAQFNLGIMFYEGKGVPQNYKLAYIWFSLAAAQPIYPGDESAIDNRNLAAKKLSSKQLIEAQELASIIQYKIDNPTKSQEQQSSISNTERKINGSGTGFIITRDGYILTCHHVIKDANDIKIVSGGKTYSAKLVCDNPNDDLALLKINGSFPAIAFSPKRSAKMGQNVFTIGYPNPSLQGVNAKFTKGAVNSLTGVYDDIRLYQISNPIQPGNSGGALVDDNGNILGIIVAMLDAKNAFKISGSLPQNVNYAVKSIYAQTMLDTTPEIGDKLLESSRSKVDAIDRVKKSTVMILSYE